jgi:hypothetical protein
MLPLSTRGARFTSRVLAAEEAQHFSSPPPPPPLPPLQDYNASVVRTVTAATLRLNGLAGSTATQRLTLAHGSWQSWVDALCAAPPPPPRPDDAGALAGVGDGPAGVSPASVDLVVGSEVTYTEAAYPALLALLFLLLRRPCGGDDASMDAGGGQALIASKRFYYGVGGSVAGFVAAAAAFAPSPEVLRTVPPRDGQRERLSAEVVGSVEDGGSMIRDVVRVRIVSGPPAGAVS